MRTHSLVGRVSIAIFSIFLLGSPLVGCTAGEEKEPVVKTTIAPEPSRDTNTPNKSQKKNPEQDKKHEIKSFGKNEPVTV